MDKRAYNTEHARNWRKEARATLIAAMGGGCVACGYDKCAHAIDFHHVNGDEKSDQVAALMAHRSWKRVVKEARKCVLLCSRCHRELHAGAIEPVKVVPDYVFPAKLDLTLPKYPKPYAGLFKHCPVSAPELRSLRTAMSLDKLAEKFKVNKRTVMRWCRDLLV